MESSNTLAPKDHNYYSPPSFSGEKIKREREDEMKAPAPRTVLIPSTLNASEKLPIDFSSIHQSCFGWTAIGKNYLPFIIRQGLRYFAMRMVESEIISKYTKILACGVFNYVNIKSYYITENEARLLNEINFFHCNGQYTFIPFSIKDVLVLVEDTEKFYEYLEFCKQKSHVGNIIRIGEMTERSGLVLINKQYLMPYITKNKACYVLQNMLPASVSSESSEVVLDKWDLAYLKFVYWNVNLCLQKVQTSDKLSLMSNFKNYDNSSTVFQKVTVIKYIRDSFMNSPT